MINEILFIKHSQKLKIIHGTPGTHQSSVEIGENTIPPLKFNIFTSFYASAG